MVVSSINGFDLWFSDVTGLSEEGKQGVHYGELRKVLLSNYVIQHSKKFRKEGDEFRIIRATRINRKILVGRHGCDNTAVGSF